MKIIAVSDTHGNVKDLRDAVQQALEGIAPDIWIHCGDGARDMDAVEPLLLEANPDMRLYRVPGNWDPSLQQLPAVELFEAEGVRMIVAHGHTLNVKYQYEELLCQAQSLGAKVAFFGHTHSPFLENSRGVYLINPGAVCQRLEGNTAYAQVTVSPEGKLRADLIKWRS